jgi:L-alanine-DL-glutamate epimerase-like enolase superfamily enzyme
VKITDVKVHLIDLGRKYHFPLHGTVKAEAGLVRVFTDDGIEGNADFCTWALPPKLLADHVLAMKPYFIGANPFDIERIWTLTFNTTRSVGSIYGPGCINVALWDIISKTLKLPLFRLLGGFRDRIRAYASTQSYEDIDSFVSLAESLVEKGFGAIKLHSWGIPDRDIDLCRTIRKALGDKTDLMIDPMGLYDRQGAIKVGNVLDELKFYWFEEPLPESDVRGYIHLRERLNVPIIGVDSLRLSLGNYADYIARGAFDMVQADAARQGISWTKKLAGVAEAFGLKFQAHAYGTPLHQAANLHLMGGINNGELFEMPVPEGIMDTPMIDTIRIEGDGWVTLPQKPGLGLDMDWKGIEKFTTAIIG